MAARRLQTYTSLWAMMPHDNSGETLPYDACLLYTSDAADE